MQTLKKNLESHKENYKLASEAYEKKALEVLEESKKKAAKSLESRYKLAKQAIRNSVEEGTPLEHVLMVNEYEARLPAPVNNSSAYEEAIALMEWETKEEIELSFPEFECFIQDKWDWKEEFELTSTALGLR